jgi:hypothetical protein
MAHRARALPSDTPGRLAEHVPAFVAGAVTGLALVAVAVAAWAGHTALDTLDRVTRDPRGHR